MASGSSVTPAGAAKAVGVVVVAGGVVVRQFSVASVGCSSSLCAFVWTPC